MRKITYIANVKFPTWKAHGIQVAKTCEALVQNNVDLEIVVPRKRQEEDPFEFYGLKKKFPIKKLWVLNIFTSTSFGWLFSSFLFGLSSFFYLIFRTSKRIIYSIDLDPVSFLGFIFLKRPCFFEMHDAKRNDFLNRILFKRAKGIIAVNDAVRNDLIRVFGIQEDKIIVCPNGVDLGEALVGDKMSACKKLGIKPSFAKASDGQSKKVAVYTGSFQHWKGIETIIKAAEDLKDIEFYLVGGSSTENVPNNVHLMGKRDFKEMPLWRTAADILIVTGTKKDKYSCHHTSPMKLFEYLATKKPIVASGTHAIKQVVSEEEVFFHEPDDPEDFKKVIRFILENKDAVVKKAEKAYLKAGEYSWDNRAKKILRFIKEKCV